MKIVLQKVNSAMQILAIVRLAQEIWTQHYTPILAPNQVPYMLAKFQSLSAITNQIEQGHFYFLIFTADVYQMDAPIYEGNSGGPLLNKFGNIVGINSFGYQNKQGLNYAVSVKEIIKFWIY